MTIRELMSSNVKACREETDLATAAKLMWDGDCGMVPVVDADGRIAGVLTDRDICIAAATRSTSPANLVAREVMSRQISTCQANDDVRAALSALGRARVRRLPVVDRENRLVGIVSMNDLATRTECRRGAEIPAEEFLDVLKTIGARPAEVAGAA